MSPIKVIRVLSLLIMAAAAAVSFGTQRSLFVGWQVDTFTSVVAPIAVDLLAIICTLAIHTDGVARKGRRAAITVLAVVGTASVSANFIAGETLGSKIVHGAMVVLYLLAEWIAAQVKAAPPAADPKRSEAGKKAAATRRANAAKRTRKPRAPRAVPTSPGTPPVYDAPSVEQVEAIAS
jgi:hypothetical protein